MMPQRWRKLIGTVLLLTLMVVWALVAMALTQGRVTQLNWALQTLSYVVIGGSWVIPAAFLIRWMERSDPRT